MSAAQAGQALTETASAMSGRVRERDGLGLGRRSVVPAAVQDLRGDRAGLTPAMTFEHAQLAGFDAAWACHHRSKPREQHAPTEHGDPSGWVSAVYEALAGDGLYLYIGRSEQLYTRLRQHEQGSGWWPLVAHFKVWLLPCEGQAKVCECQRIRTESPAHNSVGVRDRRGA